MDSLFLRSTCRFLPHPDLILTLLGSGPALGFAVRRAEEEGMYGKQATLPCSPLIRQGRRACRQAGMQDRSGGGGGGGESVDVGCEREWTDGRTSSF